MIRPAALFAGALLALFFSLLCLAARETLAPPAPVVRVAPAPSAPATPAVPFNNPRELRLWTA